MRFARHLLSAVVNGGGSCQRLSAVANILIGCKITSMDTLLYVGLSNFLTLCKDGFVAVIEIKYVSNKTSKQRIAERAKAALNQIKKSDYVQHLRIRGANPIIAFGFAFHKNMVCVESERLNQ